jgi:hypothetical protein
MSGFSFGLLGCAWSFYLGTTRAGEAVSAATGLSFYAGWVCGMGLVMLGMVFTVLSFFTRALGGVLDNFGDGDGNAELSDLIPGGGGLSGLIGGAVVGRFLNNNRDQ